MAKNIEDTQNQLASQIQEAIVDSLLNQRGYAGQPPLATGKLLSSIEVVPVESGFEISMEDYWVFVEKGRKGRGKLPPIQPIYDYVQARRIKPKKLNQTPLNVAWAIAKSLQNSEIKPRPFLQQGIDAVSEKILDKFVLAIEEDLDKAFE